MNKVIIEKIDEIIKIIENSSEYQKYLLLKEKINGNEKLKRLINEVKVLQKDVVHHLNKKDELDKKMDELNSHPVYREYTNTLFDINNVYVIIEKRINKYFQDKLN